MMLSVDGNVRRCAALCQTAISKDPQMTSAGYTNRELFDSERRFRLLVEGVVDYAICMLDPVGIVTNWNAGARRIKGYSETEIVGRHFSVFYTPEDRKAGLADLALDTARKTGRFEAEGTRVRKDGARFSASVVIDALYEHGELIGFAKITRDITEHAKAQKALAESERQFRMLVSGVTDYALYMLDPQGNVSSWNAGGEKIKGYKPAEIIGEHFSRFYTEADRKAGKPQRALSIAATSGKYEEEGWRVRKDGSFFWASVVIDPIREGDGTLIGFTKITRDISERREAQLALAKVERQLAEAQKMDALGQLTGGVAHDFNNLLMIVSGHVQTIKRLVADQPRVEKAVRAIETAADRGASLTRQLLSFARRQRLKPQAIDVAERVAAVRDVLDSGLGSSVSLSLEINHGTWPIIVDMSEFEMALVNIVLNARDAMPKGGSVVISSKNVQTDKGDFVELAIRDTGIGIPDDVLKNVFHPFFTTKPVGKGTGLGLSQVYGFVHQAGGTINVKTVLNGGTTFVLSFPRAQQPIADSFNAEATKQEMGGGNVLLVEDNPDVATATTQMLQDLGYSVRWVSDANAAIRELEVDGIDLVFSDIVMPGEVNGLQLAESIRNRRPKLPILLATGYSEAAHSTRQMFPILQKPYTMNQLSRALTELNQQTAANK
jgi:PAS domain S-box-containing protein